MANQTVGAQNLITYTLTLDSDIFTDNPSIVHVGFPESGFLQDLTATIFNVATDPASPGKTVSDNGAFPFHVVVSSDADTPEPNSLLLLAVGLTGFSDSSGRGEDVPIKTEVLR